MVKNKVRQIYGFPHGAALEITVMVIQLNDLSKTLVRVSVLL